MTPLDTNVLSALLTGSEQASERAAKLISAANEPVMCSVVYAELSAHPKGDEETLSELFNDLRIDVHWTISEAEWREAATRFRRYAERRRRSKGGKPKRLLPDFLVGVHALRAGQLVTLDKRIYAAAFPELSLLS